MDIVLPLLANWIVALLLGALARRTVFRFLTWCMVPIFVAIIYIGPARLFQAHGEGSMLWLYFGYITMVGLVSSGVGVLLAYYLRRSTP